MLSFIIIILTICSQLIQIECCINNHITHSLIPQSQTCDAFWAISSHHRLYQASNTFNNKIKYQSFCFWGLYVCIDHRIDRRPSVITSSVSYSGRLVTPILLQTLLLRTLTSDTPCLLLLTKISITLHYTWRRHSTTRTQEFGNSIKLDIVCTFVDGTDLGVSPVLFKTNLSNESLATCPLDGRSGRLLGDNRCIILGHRGFLCERPSFLLQTEGGQLEKSIRKFDMPWVSRHCKSRALLLQSQ